MFFSVKKTLSGTLARTGVIHTPNGDIETPAFIPVATKATVKALSPEQIRALGAEAVLANTYHLYLEPGEKIVEKHGGVSKFMQWRGPTFTDSGGFQVFSLGSSFGKKVSKVARGEYEEEGSGEEDGRLARVDDDGVTFVSHIDGAKHRFTPESSIKIQHALGADIIFAFDECTSPRDKIEYQKEALARTHEWAKRSLNEHVRLGKSSAGNIQQALYAVVQGGQSEELRKKSARELSTLPFDGFGIGGSFTKDDIGTAVRWVNEVLPKEKPRHLLGIGEPEDLFLAIKNGIDTFDCVTPTRMGRNGALYTEKGKINILNAKFREDMSFVCSDETCYARQFTKSYLAHLFRSHEMFAATIASIHNLHFIINLVKKIRMSIEGDNFQEYSKIFLTGYLSRRG